LDDAPPIVLVVEDDHLIQSIVEEALADAGYQIAIAPSAEQAMDLLLASEKNIRALVTDINLGHALSGWEIAQHAREINPDLPVVYMTGDSADEWASRGVPQSILVAKPFAPAQLVTAVSQLLNNGTRTG
jgi:DNA-binding response OmpR family regulator